MKQKETKSSRTIVFRCAQKKRIFITTFMVMMFAVCGLSDTAFAQTVTRGPYLQSGAPDSIVIRWRTDVASDSVVRYGLSPTQLDFTAESPGNTTEHIVRLNSLTSATTYYYSVGTQAQTLAGGDSEHRFISSPPAGAEQATRIWVVGDSGTANASARAVRDAYLNLTGNQYTNLFLMLGDNAYDDGTDSEYQRAVFDTYPSILRQTPVWPTLGNHDGRSANSNNESGVYYDIFTLPRNGEVGGLASGTEAYYSFDYANIHFVVLESFETDRSANGAMMTWLADDLAAQSQRWVIAFWHHPPYSKGSHDSDSESGMIQMRQNALPILEAGGVDLMLSGHSHSYERSFLIDRHYGSSGSFNSGNQIDAGDGRPNGDGAYEKPGDIVGDPNKGAVYIVAGSSGKLSGGSLNHRAMRVSLSQLGSMVLEVDGDTLDATFLNDNGAAPDTFRISKVASVPEVTIRATDATAGELGSDTATFTLSRTGETSAALAVDYTTSGSATAGTDYNTLSGQVTFAAGQSSATVVLQAIDDALVEPDETVRLLLSASADYDIGLPNSATATIVSDEIVPTLSISATTAVAREAGLANGVFTINRTGDSSTALTIRYSVNGSATSGADYAPLPGVAMLPAGATSMTLNVVPIDDNEIEPDESVTVMLASDPGYELGSPTSATVVIESDEVLPTVNVTASDNTATEAGTTTGSFTVTRSAGTSGPLTIGYTVSGTATAGSDYAALSGSVSLTSGQNSATILVTPVDDTAVEPDETVVVTLAASADYGIGTSASAAVNTISDDVLATVSVSVSDGSATEVGPTTGSFTISRSQNTSGALNVRYTVTGTATPGGDYTTLSGTLNLAAGQTSAPVTVAPIDDALAEVDETVVLTLSADAAYDISGPASGTVTIVSEDVQPAEPVTLPVVNLFDNKDGKNYFSGGPDGSDPVDDINSMAQDDKVEILGDDASFWWEATYAAPDAGLGNPSSVIVNLDYRAEEDWDGSFRVEYRVGSTVLASATLPGNGNGSSADFAWDLSSVVTSLADIANGRVRFLNTDDGGKKVFVNFSALDAVLGGPAGSGAQ